MSLGYALLHPRQLDAALVIRSEKRTMDTMMDIFCGALGIDNVDAELVAAFEAQFGSIEGFMGRFETLFEPGRTLEQIKFFGDFDFSDPQSISGAVDGLCAFLETAEADQVKAFAIPVIDAVLEVLPNLETEVVASFASRRLTEIIDVLKAPLRSGRKDVAAIKAYRAAMSLRCMLDPVHVRLNAMGRVDLKLVLREILIGMLDGLDGVNFAPLRDFLVSIKGQFGGVLKALFDCAGGGSVAAGAQTMADIPLTILNEVQAVPHTVDNAPGIWALDLSTNILNLFNLIWEIVRTRPFVDRGADGAFLIIGVIWHTVRTVMRAAVPDVVSRPVFEADAGQIFINWLFSDWGDVALQLFLRLMITIFYEAPDDKTNWALMLASRWLVYLSNTLNFRLWYQFARSMWYFGAHKDFESELDDVADRSDEVMELITEMLGGDRTGQGIFSRDRKLNKMPLGRMMMGVVPIVWAVSGIIAATPALPWDNFEVEHWGAREYLIIFLIPAVVWALGHFWISHAAGLSVFDSITFASLPDIPLFATVIAGMLLMTLALGFVVGGLESDAQAAALAGVIAFPSLLFLLLVIMGVLWIDGDGTLPGRERPLAGFTQTFSFFATIVMGLIASISWWFIADDGRDREGDYDDLDVTKTPYLLPMRAGENWYCGQSFHGVFSHLLSSSTSHYAVDMNEAADKAGTASRSGIIISVTQGNPDDESTQNAVTLMHSEWAENADPGSEDERVLTYSNFVHTRELGVHGRAGQFVPRGMHLTDIDSTGRSAQHHTHYAGQTAQKGAGREGLPFIFGDVSLREFRNYPPLSIFPTMGHIPGKPLSFAFYISNNDEADPHPHALTLTVLPAEVVVGGDTVSHSHRILITNDLLMGGVIPETLTLNTTVDAGHFHTVTLTRAQLLDVFRMDAPPSASTEVVAGHSHTIGPATVFEFFELMTDDVTAAVNGDDTEHSHSLYFGPDYLTRNTIPPAGFTFAIGRSARHAHDITLTTAQIQSVLAPGNPGLTTTGVTTTEDPADAIGPHTHGTIRSAGWNRDFGNMNVTIVEPPAAQLTAQDPGPYDLLGDRMVLRVNERATEWHFWGGERTRAIADIAADYGLGASDQIRVGAGGTVVAMPAAPAPRASVRDTVTSFSAQLRAPAPLVPPLSRSTAPPLRRVSMRSDPVLVVETRRRGNAARLELTGGTVPNALLPEGAAVLANGTGPFGDLRTVARDDFRLHVTNFIQNGWDSPPSPITTTVDAVGRLTVMLGGGPASFAGSSSRIGQVAEPLYNGGPRRFRATGSIPFGTGRLGLAAGYSIPLLATPAVVSFPDPGEGSILVIAVNDAVPPVSVVATADLAMTARRVMQQVEGLRAYGDSGNLVLETLSAGPVAALSVTLNSDAPLQVNGEGPADLGYDDLTRLPVTGLEAIIDDAVARDVLPAHAVTHNLRVEADTDVLRIAVDAPATLSASVVTTSSVDPIAFVTPQASPQEIVSQALPANLRFDGPAWIDIAITDGTTQTLRIPLDGEPARLDILPERLPDGNETLTFDVNGVAVNVTLDGTQRTMADVAEAIGAASDALVVRLAYRMTVEDMLWGDQGANMELQDTLSTADGLTLAGFLSSRNFAVNDRLARGEDMMAQGGVFPAPENRAGQLVDVVDFARVGSPAGSQMRLTATGVAASIVVTVTPGDDPLGFGTGATTAALETLPLAATVDLQGFAKIYHFRALAADGSDVAHGFMHLAAQPAIARTTQAASLPVAGAGVLEIGITQPPVTRRLARVDLSGVTTLDEAATRINAASPQVRAWVARVSEIQNIESNRATHDDGDLRQFDERLHIETAGGGADWRLDLGDLQTAAALGYPLSKEDGGSLVFEGRGNVRDGRAVTRDEIANAIQEAVDSMTGSDNPAGAQNRLSVLANGDSIELRSAEGPLELVFEPPALANQIVTDIQPELTVLNAPPGGGGAPPATLRLDSGRILIRAGGRGLAAVELFARPAVVQSDVPIPAADAAAVTEQLDLLKANRLRVRINGTTRTLPLVPPDVTTLEDTIAFLSRATLVLAGWQGDDWWIGLLDVPGVPGAKRCVIQTHLRGTDASIRMDLSNFTTPYPASGILGFTGERTSADGFGNVPNMDAVAVTAPSDTLLALVAEAAERGGARQAIYAASADATHIRVQGNLTSTVLSQSVLPIAAPGGVSLVSPAPAGGAARLIESEYLGVRAIEPGILEIMTDDTVTANPRVVRTVFHVEPARIGPFILPTDLQSLDGKTLALTVNGVDVDIPLTANASTTNLEIVRQLEQGANWELRAISPDGSTELVVETLRRGASAQMSLRAGAVGVDAVTDDPATGLTRPADLAAIGSGSVSDESTVSADEYAAVLQNGMVSDRRQADQTIRDAFVTINGSAYDPPELDIIEPRLPSRSLPREYARIESQRSGCASSLIPLTLGGEPALPSAFNMDRTLERAPAVRAAVRIPPFGTRTLSGRLHIQFDENDGIADLPLEQTIIVDVPNQSYDAPQFAALLHGRLFDAGIGAAQAYGDGSIMVETFASGIPGSVRIPAQSTPAGDATLAEILIPGGAFARGWPGAGRTAPGTARRPGFRSALGDMRAVPNWEFSDGNPPTPPMAGTAAARTDLFGIHGGAVDDTLADTAMAVDTLLAGLPDPALGGAARRIGIAKVGADGAMYIEGLTDTFDLVNGIESFDSNNNGTDDAARFVAALPVDPPPRVGGTPERQLEPAANLRRTHEARTVRILRDKNGHGVLAEHDDLGWVRHPAHPEFGSVVPFEDMPAGRFLSLTRVDAARTSNYDPADDMIALAGVHLDDPTRPVVLQVRYWLDWQGSEVMGVRFGPDDQVMVRIERDVR